MGEGGEDIVENETVLYLVIVEDGLGVVVEVVWINNVQVLWWKGRED